MTNFFVGRRGRFSLIKRSGFRRRSREPSLEFRVAESAITLHFSYFVRFQECFNQIKYSTIAHYCDRQQLNHLDVLFFICFHATQGTKNVIQIFDQIELVVSCIIWFGCWGAQLRSFRASFECQADRLSIDRRECKRNTSFFLASPHKLPFNSPRDNSDFRHSRKLYFFSGLDLLSFDL